MVHNSDLKSARSAHQDANLKFPFFERKNSRKLSNVAKVDSRKQKYYIHQKFSTKGALRAPLKPLMLTDEKFFRKILLISDELRAKKGILPDPYIQNTHLVEHSNKKKVLLGRGSKGARSAPL